MDNGYEKQVQSVNELQEFQPQQTHHVPMISNTPKTPLIISGMLLGFILLGVGGCVLGVQRGRKITSVETTSPNITISPSSTMQSSPTDLVASPIKITEVTSSWANFTHPVVGYSMEYPASWTGGLDEIPEAIVQDYQDFSIESPDHQVSEGYPVLEKGAEFLVRVEKTQYFSIVDIFNNDSLAQEIAFDKTTTKVDGLEAIQYDYSYEGHRATMTIFTKKGNYYTVRYRYVDNDSKQNNWVDYIRLLNSFKLE
jgi:hypothetical protein